MKKILSSSLALLLLVLTFTGCSKETDALIGTWAGEVNYASYFNEGLASTAGSDLAAYWKVDEFKLTIVMTFRKDGTYSMTVDREKLTASIEQLKQTLGAGLTHYMQDLIDASGMETTVEELMNTLGISVDTLLADAINDEVINALIAECTFEGNFDAKDGKLYTSAGKEFSIDQSIYETYEVTENTLTLLSIVSGEETSRLDETLYPITLNRI
jgi:hypothetical protein